MAGQSFRAAGYPWRLYAGPDVIEKCMEEIVFRIGTKRAFVVCSPSVNSSTETIRRIEQALGDKLVGIFDKIEKDSTYTSVAAATGMAQESNADSLIAVGGGSVLVAARAVAIFLAEPGIHSES